ncbi:MAG: TonB-dependent receptor [Acidobacteria bacterium]|nr:TonB-dependent receptor [Acidobacteriota bacterium]
MRNCLYFVAMVLAVMSPAYAQTGALTGTITDPDGAVLPGVQIRVTNLDTNAERMFVTNDRGDYNVPLLPAGTYRIEAALPGFKTAVADKIEVNVDDRLRIDLTLQVGEIAEKLVVTEAPPLLQSETSSVGIVIDNQKVVELPLNGRQFESLAQLVPGSLSAAPGSSLSFRGGFNAAGARETANSNMLDGLDNNDPAINNFTLRPIVDAIQEFKVLANTYSAEFGRGGGAQVIVSTKSGTNEFHAGVWEFLRNDKLDARDFFNKKGTGPKPPFRRNQFGAIAGAPIIRDRTFFFAAYEGIRRRQLFTSLQQVPTEAFRRGDFSAATAPIRDPENRSGPVFLGNIIPANRINPIAKRILDRGSFPLPTPGLAAPNNFLAINPFPNDVNQYSARLDHRIDGSNTLFGRYGFTKDTLETPCAANGQTNCLPGFAHDDITRAHSLSIVDTHIFSPRMILELRAGFNRQLQSRIALTSGRTDISSELGIPGSPDPRDFGHPSIVIPGFSTIGDRGYQSRAGTTGQAAASLNYTAPSHSIRAGVDLRKILFYAGSNFRETIRFSDTWTGNTFADFLLGLPSQTSRDPTDSFGYHVVNSYDWFVQDDYIVSNRLTLNLGLRYEYNTPDVEKQNRLAQLNVVTLKYEIAGRDGASRALYSPDKNNFGPRLGFAFRPNGGGKTVVRGGYGVFYDIAVVGNNFFFVRTGPPFQKPETFNAGSSLSDLSLSNPFPTARLTSSPIFDSPAIDPQFRDAYLQHWSLGVQRQLPKNTVFEVTYVGNKGTRLVKTVDVNQAFPEAGPTPPPVQSRRPIPNYGAVPVLQSSGSSIYHGLLGRLQRRLTSGLSFLASYTYGHAIDDSTGGNVAQDSRNLKADRGSSDFDARQRFVISYIYELPFGRQKQFGRDWGPVLNTLFGGWELSGIGTFQSGRPIFVQLSNQNSATGSTRDRPDIAYIIDPQYIQTTAKPVIANRTDKTVYLDPAVFSIPARGTFGNAPRNYFDGSGTNNWDLMIAKNFRNEGFNVQFRAEFFNAFNHPSFNQPNRNPDNRAFGTITSTLLQNRQIQFGLKITN